MRYLIAALLLLSLAGTAEAVTVRSATADAVILDWTAPGDDGNVGTATLYEMRYKTVAPADTTQAAINAWWGGANSVSSLPVPAIAGTPQSVTAAGLTPGFTYYFVMRTADEVPNWSLYSNVASKNLPDMLPPARIVDERVR